MADETNRKVKYATWLLGLAVLVVACVLTTFFSSQAQGPCLFIYAVVVLALAWILKDAFNLLNTAPPIPGQDNEKALKERRETAKEPRLKNEAIQKPKTSEQKSQPAKKKSEHAPASKRAEEAASEYDYDG